MPGNNLIAEIAKEFISGNTEDVVDVVTFCEAPWGLNIKLLPVQKFILKAYYGLPLNRTERNIEVPDVTNEHTLYRFSEVQLLKWLYEEGRCNTDVTEGKNFHELVLAIGRRGTKSSMSAYISNYELYKLVKRGDPSRHYGFPPNTQFYVLNVASADEQASVVFQMIQGLAMQCPYMRDRCLHNTMSYFDLQTDSDMKLRGKPKASLISVAGGCASNSLRGRNAIVVIMDELAHFISNNGRFSGDEVYKALTPSIASFGKDGKIISISSPYAKYGVFYRRYQESFDEQDITLMFKMYSSMVNPTIPSEILRAARRRDRVGFMCEYGGEFSDAVTAWIDDESEFRRCVINMPAPAHGVRDEAYYMGVDIGFKNDGTAIVIVHKDRKTGKIILDYATVWFSGSSDVWEDERSIYRGCNKYAGAELLKMADVIKEIKELHRWFPIKGGIFDQSNGYALAELLQKAKIKNIEMVHFNDRRNSDVYQLAKRLYAEGLVQLFDHPVLVPEMLSLEAERKVGRGGNQSSIEGGIARGTIEVRAPARSGAHDDISDAYVRAVWACYKGHKDKPIHVATGAGGAVGAPGRHAKNVPDVLKVKQETQAAFFMRKRKLHGDHPRGGYKLKRRLPGSVRM